MTTRRSRVAPRRSRSGARDFSTGSAPAPYPLPRNCPVMWARSCAISSRSRPPRWTARRMWKPTRTPTRSGWSSCASARRCCSKSWPGHAARRRPRPRRCTKRRNASTMARDEFAHRRRQLMRLMGRDSIAVLPAAPVRHRNSDVEYPYRQDSDFHYLTGFSEPEAAAVLVPGRAQAEYILFVRERDPARESWDGRRAGPAGAARDYGADDAFPISDMDEILPGLMENRALVFYNMGAYADFDQRVVGWVNGLRTQARNGRHPPQEFVALDHVLHDMRLYKSSREIELLRTAAQIAARAHQRVMRFCHPGATEYEVMAELLHEFRRHNADTAYAPIVGGGPNSCVLHYRENDQPLKDGDLLLVDAGCEFECYASDITRTFPVNGRFTSEQRAVYEIVLEANRAAIERVRPGNHWDDPHTAAVKVITQGLVRLGLLKGRVAQLIRSGAYKRFFIDRK